MPLFCLETLRAFPLHWNESMTFRWPTEPHSGRPLPTCQSPTERCAPATMTFFLFLQASSVWNALLSLTDFLFILPFRPHSKSACHEKTPSLTPRLLFYTYLSKGVPIFQSTYLLAILHLFLFITYLTSTFHTGP